MFDDIGADNRNSLSTGFFGKLPGFPDFIKFNAGGRGILLIDNWIQEGLALAKIRYKDQWKNYYNNCSKINFIYPFTGTENFIHGVILPSKDKSGRSYPFILFDNINKTVSDDLPYYLIPSAFQKLYIFFNEIIDLNNSSEDLTNLKELTTSVKSILPNTHSLNDEYKRFISETQIGDITHFGDEKASELIIFFEERLNILEHLVVFNFPAIIVQQSNSFIISYYIQLLQKVFKNSDSTPGIFWMKRKDSSWLLFLSFIKPTPKDFLDLMFYESLASIKPDHGYKNDTSLKTIFLNNSVINKTLSLSEFLNLIKNYLY